MYIFEHKLHESFRRNYNLYIRVIRKIRVQKINILNSSLMFDLSLQELKADTFHNRSSALAEHSLSIFRR